MRKRRVEWRDVERLVPPPLELARMGAHGRDWYDVAAGSIRRYALSRGLCPRTVAGVLAVTSPRVPVSRNVRITRAFLETGDVLPGTLGRSIAAARVPGDRQGFRAQGYRVLPCVAGRPRRRCGGRVGRPGAQRGRRRRPGEPAGVVHRPIPQGGARRAVPCRSARLVTRRDTSGLVGRRVHCARAQPGTANVRRAVGPTGGARSARVRLVRLPRFTSPFSVGS